MAIEKIVVITRNMVGDGAERVIAQLSNYFVAQGKVCKIITLNDDEVFYALDKRVAVLPVGEKRWRDIPHPCGEVLPVYYTAGAGLL